MEILIIGNGGREHALANSLYKSKSCSKLYFAPFNTGMDAIAEFADIDINNFKAVKTYCELHKIDLVVIGPEKPLAEGMTDYLIANGIKVFGPLKFASQLESSKDFAKKMMQKYNIPTASFKTFSYNEFDKAHQHIDMHSLPVVLKADGLAAGKGVMIAQNHKEAHNYLDEIFSGKFGDAGKNVVIEEYLQGEEASVFAVCDGQDYITLAPSQDHKRAFDGDMGPNTGGMGSYAPAPIVNKTVMSKVKKEIIEPVLKAMNDENVPFIGCLYCGLMIENDNPKVVEFNVRFGDPEIQSVLSVFQGDFAGLLYSAASGKIDKSNVENVVSGNAACVVLASDGYPGNYEKGYEIKGLDKINDENTIVFHAGTEKTNNKILTSGGRVLGVTSKGMSIREAIEKAYTAVEKIEFKNKYYRKDIGFRIL
jgi:phosphoribosylamine--glycine ligase